MIYKHRFLKDDLLKEKWEKQVTVDSPIVVLVEKDQFLHYTLQKSLAFLQMPHEIILIDRFSVEGRRKTMNHQLPTLVFSNTVLEGCQFVQFLCDAYLNDTNVLDFEQRKGMIKKLVRLWRQIFLMQRYCPYKYEKLKDYGVDGKKSYQNLIFQELTMLLLYYQDGLLKRIYNEYNLQVLPLQEILFVDIVSCILKIPQTFVDYCLRSSFISLIELKNKIVMKVDSIQIDGNKNMKYYILIEQQPINVIQWDSFRVNWKKFFISIGVFGVLYGIFGKN